MKLYDVPNKSYVKIVQQDKTPPASIPVEKEEVLFFDHIDGMYSYCKNKDGELVHPAAWTEVAIVDETGKIIKQ